MDDDQVLLELMKTRIVRSYKWREDIVIPLSEELEISTEDLEQILIKRLDMSSLEAMQPRFESARARCIKERIHADLRLCWLLDVMDIISLDQAEHLKSKITKEVLEGKNYDDALEEGKKELLEILRGN
jgi:energy-converting hydrogenase A subunit M